LTIAQRQERTRLQIIDTVRQHKDMSARQIAYELSVYGIWLSPVKVAHFIKGDKHLQKQIRIEARPIKGNWTLVYSLKARWGGE
jgi:DNA-directed RNA polymerase beta' subunit